MVTVSPKIPGISCKRLTDDICPPGLLRLNENLTQL